MACTIVQCTGLFFFHSGIPEGTTSLTVYFTVRLFLHCKRLSARSSTGPQCLCWPTSLQLSVYFKFLAGERLTGRSTGIAALLTEPGVLLILVSVQPCRRACVHAAQPAPPQLRSARQSCGHRWTSVDVSRINKKAHILKCI